jgi:uncharacterized membrane protein YgdD (TMEM256/DUF423 family)
MSPGLARGFLAAAALLLAVATALGAVASHALGSVLDAGSLHSFETGIDFQFLHALGLIGIALFAERQDESLPLKLSATLLLVGIVLFCGGVYASSLDGPRLIARLAPAGGICLIVGWLVAAFAILRARGRLSSG